jgi:putative SOS response-associated peptidase YedK
MCGRYTLAAGPEYISEYFGLESPLPDFQPSYNISPGGDVPVIWQAPADGRACSMMHWGLIPHWAKEPSTKYRMINAKAETLDERPAYRSAFRHRRCLIPASGFYEWKAEPNGKQPYYIQPANAELFAFAGLWEYWEGNHTINSCTIITIPANHSIAAIHDRMPGLIARQHFSTWLDPNFNETPALQALLLPDENIDVKIHPVSKTVNNPATDNPELIEPVPATLS